ncbi:MAG TPA: hypothetical protein VMH28_14240 [Candidatus Acidoferrales bacterium]|nr:hypothetical protein [Candidatus Acidoferrales bacterium]
MIHLVPFTADWIEATRAFNNRVAATGFDFPLEPAESSYLAVDGDAVRGAYMLRRQAVYFHGDEAEAAHFRLPLSEGTADRAYLSVGVQLLRHAMRQQPLLYALGMGGMANPLPRLLAAAGWRLAEVPFFFKVVRPFRFLRGIKYLRHSRPRRLAMDLAAFSGAGWACLRLIQPAVRSALAVECVDQFGAWADDLWWSCRGAYACIAQRDSGTLNERYGGTKYLRLKVSNLGWAVALDTQMRGDANFGYLRVATIADTLSVPGAADDVILATTAFLERRGVDLIISNQMHVAWREALRAARFRAGPSNFVFAVSKPLAARFEDNGQAHINRGDGDGPIHL